MVQEGDFSGIGPQGLRVRRFRGLGLKGFRVEFWGT